VRNTASDNGLTLTVYAGTTGVQLAWDAEEGLREDLLGFAIKRYGGTHPEGAWLQGGIGFPAQHHPPGEFLDTHLAPIQAFRWGDYTVRPDTDYRYELVPMYAPADALRPGATASTTLRTEKLDVAPHSIAFNRAVAASQAYSRRFGEADPHENAAARAWLARGLDDFIDAFIARAGGDSALDIVIYEYELERIRQALLAAAVRGASVRIVYHAASGDEQTATNAANIAADGWPRDAVRPRVTSNICHDKTIVFSRVANGERRPEAVLTGSTNWTFNGLYYQANVGHVVDDGDVARRYLALFEQLFAGATPSDMRAWLADNDPVPSGEAVDEPLQLLFSPRPDRSDLDYYVSLIGGATRSLIFATAFDLDDAVLSALAGEGGARRILRYGLQNSASRVTGYNRDLARNFTATGRLRSAPDEFLQEHTPGQRGGILMHAKVILLDFDTARPTLISGSANYSVDSSENNDENTLVIRGDARVADIYLAELFRLFDHYRFRYNWSHPAAAGEEGGGTEARRAVLDDTPAWTDRYYADANDPHAIERRQLSRPLTAAPA
jgi:phosphatidylserine/phosphatidylglycerophosphate/cardiolipin synthase-like enzyme